MKILVAPDSFKESLTAEAAARAMAQGARRACPGARIISLPMADGGEGTLEALAGGGRGRLFSSRVPGPLGNKVAARWGWLASDRTAVVEMAQASGLPLVRPRQRNPLKTTSYGTGLQLRAALDRGARQVILTLGGVATNDAGAGFAEALGYRLLDARGEPIPRGAAGLLKLSRIDRSRLHPRLARTSFVAACDVANPLCGPKGSAAVYGPQKGATPAMVPVIEKALRNFARVVRRDLGRDVLDLPGGGAAGGAGAGAAAFLGAELKPGVEIVLEASGFRRHLKGADLALTAEGRIDRQTAFGKTPAGVARAARKAGVPVLAFCGELGPGWRSALATGISAVFTIAPRPATRKESMRRAGPWLAAATERAVRDRLARD